MLQTWFKIFYRNSKKNWLNILVNILGLTLGFAGLLIVLLYSNDEESYNKWNPNKEDVYRIANKSIRNGIWHVATSAEAILFKSDIPEVEETILISPHYRSRVLIFNEKKAFTKKVTLTDPGFFDFFPFMIVDGSTQKFKESRNHIAVSSVLAKRLFGNEEAINKLVKIGEKNYVITCVYKVPGNSHFNSELLMQFETPFELHWGNYNNELFCKLTKDADINEVKQKMDNLIIEKFHKPQAEEGGVTLDELKKRHGFMEVLPEKLSTLRLHYKAQSGGPEGKGNYQLLIVLLSLSILLIVISCVNFINLSTASASQRAKEVGVKKTLGLLKKQLIFQYVLEILLQGFIALLLSLILVELVLPTFNEFIGKDISILNTSILLKIIVTAVLVALFIGCIPAIYLSNFKTVEVLKGNFSRSKKGIIVRNSMLAVQFLISGFFLIGVLVIYSQMNYMVHKDLGFEKEQTIVVDVFRINDVYKKYELTKKELIKHQNITNISASMFIPGEGNVNGTSLKYNDISFNSGSNLIDYNYVDFAKLKMLKGRAFSAEYTSDTITSILINETAARRLGIYDNPIGKKVKIGWQRDDDPKQLEVVGMIKDYHFDGFDTKIEAMFLIHWGTFSFSRNWIHAMQFKIKSDNIQETIANIEDFWKMNVDNEYPFTFEFLDEKFAKTYKKYEQQQTMFLVLSVLVILISLLGLFALATLTIQQRLKEVAIRKTLGASVKEIVVQLVKSFLKITGIASIILLPIAYYVMQFWLDDFVYRIEMPLWPYVLVPFILILLVFLVVGIKAINATKIDLIKYLKFE